MYICTCNSITKHVYFPRGIVVVTASYPEIIGHSVRVITVRGKTNQRREGVSSQYHTVKTPNTDPLSALIPCWKNQPTAEKKNIKKKVIAQCCPHANTN